jgi:type IV secretory pathway VirB2 component (pilin)
MTLSSVLPVAAGLFLASVLLSEPAHADAFGRVTTILQNIVSTLAGPLGRALATIGVIIVGLMWTFGQIDLKRAGAVVVGIGIIFGAAEIVGQLSGG